MSKRLKTTEQDAAEYYFAHIPHLDPYTLQGMPFDVLVQVFSALSEKDLLDLHAKSANPTARLDETGASVALGKRVRDAAYSAIEIKVNETLGIPLAEIEQYIPGPVNYRFLLLAIMVFHSPRGSRRRQVWFSRKQEGVKDTVNGSILTIMINKESKRTRLYSEYNDDHELMKMLTQTLYTNNVISSLPIIARLSDDDYLRYGFKYASRLRPETYRPDAYVVQLLCIYFPLTFDVNISLDNSKIPVNVLPEFRRDARIRCSVCASPGIGFECSDCKLQFCSTECAQQRN